MSSTSSTLPVELWHQILRSVYEVLLFPSSPSLDSDSGNNILLRDYPWVDTSRTRKYRASASARHGAVVRSISQVCRSWKTFAIQLQYQEIELGPFCFSFHDLLTERQLHSNIFYETRRLNVTTNWFNYIPDLSLLVQNMPRLEWLQLSTHIIEESYCTLGFPPSWDPTNPVCYTLIWSPYIIRTRLSSIRNAYPLSPASPFAYDVSHALSSTSLLLLLLLVVTMAITVVVVVVVDKCKCKCVKPPLDSKTCRFCGL